MEGKTCVLSGSGNVALYCAQKLIQLGAKVVTLSDSSGFIHDADGLDEDKLHWLIDLKTRRRGRIHEYAEQFGAQYHEGTRPWGVPCELAFPCAVQNELDQQDARTLAVNGCQAVAEGANMPTTVEAIKVLHDAGVLFGPGKAANAGGVAVSGLEMSQNSIRMAWAAEELERRLRDIMNGIHDQCVHYGQDNGQNGDQVNYVRGANVAGFRKVADAMLAYGAI